MFFVLDFKQSKAIKELMKNQHFTAKELADQLKIDVTDILKIDNLSLRTFKNR